MKLRLDLLKYVTAEDIMEEVLANSHRYNPEPLFSKTGVGSLKSATPEEVKQELARMKVFTKKLKQRMQLAEGNGKKNSPKKKSKF